MDESRRKAVAWRRPPQELLSWRDVATPESWQRLSSHPAPLLLPLGEPQEARQSRGRANWAEGEEAEAARWVPSLE